MDPSHPLPSTKKVLFGSTRSSTHNSSGEENCIPGTSQVFYGPINIPSTSSVRNQPGPSTSQLDSNDQSSSEQHALANALQRNLTLDSQSSDGDVPMWGQQPPANAQASEELHLLSPQQDVDRMGDDGYPLVTDMDGSDRQRELERQRVIERVIDQQAFDQDVIESLAHSNHQRVYGEESDETNGEDTDRERPPRNLMGNPAPVLNEDGSLTSRGQEIVNSYHSMMRNLAESRVSVPPMYYGDESNGAEIQSYEYNQMTASTSRRLLPAQFPANTSHVLAIGRKPSSSGQMNTVNRPANADETHPLGWQAAKSSLKERISYMYCNDVLADVYFIVGKDENRQRIPAHKFVLSIGSVVFDAMFNGGLTPNGQSANSLGGYDPVEIELPDVEATAFLTLLKFLYSDEVSIGPESVMTTLYTAKKYAVPAMESACVEFLKQSLGADNAFMLLTQARLFDEPQLAELCLEIIDKNTSEALTADGFTEIDLETLCMVLTRDTLRVREAPLFQAVISWAKEECFRRDLEPTTDNKRIVLGKALQLIRFPLMTVEEFAQTAAQSGLLFDRELVNLFLHFTVNPKPPTTFIDRPRCAIAGKELVVNRFQRIEGRWGYSGTPDRIKFTVDRKIYVVGFGLHGSIHGPHEYQVTIQIIHCGTGKVLAHNDTSFVCDGSSNTFRVCFKEPVEMMPSVTYIASACLKGPDSHYGTKGLRRIVHQSASGGVVTFQFTYAAGNNNGTSVEDGQIPEIIFYTKLN